MPNRTYDEGIWQATVADGVNAHLPPNVRRGLNLGYTKNRQLAGLNSENNAAYQRLLSLSRPLPLDASVRFALLQELDELRGRVELMSHLSGQSMANWRDAGMLPRADLSGRTISAVSGTYRFCRSQRLPVRPVGDAATPIRDKRTA
jgi:hypothetical protein